MINKKEQIFLDSIKIENYFSIQKIELKDLKNNKEIYFLGENGTGKTILLQAILMVLRNKIDDAQVIEKLLNNKEIIKNKSEFKISATDNNNSIYSYIFDFENKSNYYSNVFAYGVVRMFSNVNENKIDKKGYLTLFSDNANLKNPENWLKDIKLKYLDCKDKKLQTTLNHEVAIKFLQKIINIDGNEIKIEIIGDNVKFFERNAELKFEELSHGFRSMLIWASDLLSRLTDKQPNITKINEFEAIVLVDEIDLLIHPRLAYKLMKKLRSIFPKIQWFITTHSPIITLGASQDAVFYKLHKIEGETKIGQPYNKGLNMSANTMLSSLLWNIEILKSTNQQLIEIDDDYITKKIYEAITLKIKNEPLITDNEVEEEINKMLNDWFKEEEK